MANVSDNTPRGAPALPGPASSSMAFNELTPCGTTSNSCIPTVGEYAQWALKSFLAVRNEKDLPWRDSGPRHSHSAAVELVRVCLALMHKFPMQARAKFSSVLPFTKLELELIGRGWVDDESVAELIALRIVEWTRRSPVSVGEANVHAADFLVQLIPHLDLWSQRQKAAEVAERLTCT